MNSQRQKGVLLTLGITFICLIVLSFATLILRNAENSDVRLTELSSIDRVYTLTSSLERGISRSYFSLTGINLTLNNDTLTIVKDTKRSGTPPNYYNPPEFNDDQIFNMKATDVFLDNLASSLTYGFVTLDNYYGYNWPKILILSFYYPTYVNDLSKSFLFYGYTDDIGSVNKDYNFRHTFAASQECCLYINNRSEFYPINTTYQLFFLGNNLSELKEITVRATHPTRCPIINWTDARRLSVTSNGPLGSDEVKIKMTIITDDQAGNCLPSDTKFSQFQNDAILNRTSGNTIFSQIFFLDNLTNDPNLVGYNFLYGETLASASKERPVVFINSQPYAYSGTLPISAGSNILYLLQYDNPIKWEVTLRFSVGPLEAYSTETATASLSSLNISRVQRPARFK